MPKQLPPIRLAEDSTQQHVGVAFCQTQSHSRLKERKGCSLQLLKNIPRYHAVIEIRSQIAIILERSRGLATNSVCATASPFEIPMKLIAYIRTSNVPSKAALRRFYKEAGKCSSSSVAIEFKIATGVIRIFNDTNILDAHLNKVY